MASTTNELSVTEVLEQLTLEEKVSLLSARAYWRVPSIPRLGIKALKVCH